MNYRKDVNKNSDKTMPLILFSVFFFKVFLRMFLTAFLRKKIIREAVTDCK
jgi:hypothetical protein